MRRHALRTTSRTAVLLGGDVVALLVTRTLLRAVMSVAAPYWLEVSNAVGPLASPGRPGSLVFTATIFLALAVTGAYGQQRAVNSIARLAAAVLLSGSATIVVVAAAVGVSRAVVDATVFSVVFLAVLVIARAAAEWFLKHVWPRGRNAAVAVLAGPPHALEADREGTFLAAHGEYTIGAQYVMDVGRSSERHRLTAEVRALLGRENAEVLVLCEALPEHDVRALLDAAMDADCRLLYPARALAIEGVRPRLVWHSDRPFLELGAPVLRPHALVTKRITDVLGSLVLLLLAAPVMLLIGLAIRLDSPGPAIFAQHRAGLGGRRFRMLKFRTMHARADEEKQSLAHLNHTGDHRLFKIPSDPRVTRLGRFLRRWSLDELPQLFNVLRGDMSLVGPRPFFEADLATYDDHHFRRLDTKPGITGLWQVGGRSDVVEFEDVVFLDREYIEHWSFWLDLRILARTVPAVMSRKGAF